MRMRTRLTAAALLAATAFGLAATPGAPAGADLTPVPAAKVASKTFSFSGFGTQQNPQPMNTEQFTAPGRTPIVGQFAGNAAEDILWYTPGAGGDALWTNDGTMQFSSSPTSISATYTPQVGTFAAPDGRDDILWYHATGVSQLWDFNADGSYTPTALPNVNGPGQILVGDFALDGVDDVIRYRPGSGSDSWWDFQNAGIMNRSFNVNGTYTPLVGTFGGDAYDDILFYVPGANPDFLWDFTGGGAKTEWDLSINGTFTPVVGRFSGDGRDDVVWYRPGAGADSIWDFDGVGYTSKPLTINGTYAPVAGTFLQSSSSWTDIVWYGAGGAADTAWRTINGSDFAYSSHGTSIGGVSVAAVGRFHLGYDRETMLIRH